MTYQTANPQASQPRSRTGAIVALVILVFFGLGYAFGRMFL